MEAKQEQIRYPGLPLAVYREIAAHLQQVRGVTVTLIAQEAQSFDYAQSQVSGLMVEYSGNLGTHDRQRIEEILSYYADRYGGCDRSSE